MLIFRFQVLLFGQNPQAVAYSAQPLCWSGSGTSSPTTYGGSSTERWSQNTLRVVTASVLHPLVVFNIPLYFKQFSGDGSTI